jgi:hypothetical protein
LADETESWEHNHEEPGGVWLASLTGSAFMILHAMILPIL